MFWGYSAREPTEAETAALALPGEDWPTARQRAKRLLNAVYLCVPCEQCDPEHLAHYRLTRGWVDKPNERECPDCAYSRDSQYERDLIELSEPRK